MKKLIFITLLACIPMFAQTSSKPLQAPNGVQTPGVVPPLGGGGVGINTTTPQAALDVSSTVDGMLIPRMTTTQRDAISLLVTSKLIYNTSTSQFEYYNGTAWAALGGGGFDSLQSMYDADSNNLNVTDGTNTLNVSPQAVFIQSTDGSLTGFDAGTMQVGNSSGGFTFGAGNMEQFTAAAGGVFVRLANNVVNTVTSEAPNLPDGTYTPVYSATVNGGSKVLADTEGNIDLTVSGGGSGTVTSVTSANTDISIADPATTPVLTLNSGTGANQIAKRNGSGVVPGDITGNAATATALQTSRNINGVAFDGTANITVTAAAGTLTGTTLASNVVSSSLTSVGVVTSGTWQATPIAAAYGGTGTTSLSSGIPTFLTTASSANLAAALTDEVGTTGGFVRQGYVDGHRSITHRFHAGSVNWADNTSYYYGGTNSLTAYTSSRLTVRAGITATNIMGTLGLYTTAQGSSEAATVVLKNITQNTTVTLTSNLLSTVQSNGLNFPLTAFAITANDELEIIVTTPTYATNPTGCLFLADVALFNY